MQSRPTRLKSVRLPIDLIDRLEQEPDKNFTDALVRILDDHYAVPAAARAGGQGDLLSHDGDQEKDPFKCPGFGCTFTSRSKAAVCGTHGRRVVPT